MRFWPTDISGVVIVELDLQSDDRGAFARSFCTQEFAAAGIPFEIAQANVSRNTRAGTLRGMHYQAEPHGEPKVVSCVSGRIFDVAVDMRPNSPTYLKWTAAELSGENGRALHIPAGLAHGFLTLEPDSEVHYLMGAPYAPGFARGLRWDDPAIGIEWPHAPQVISDRDAGYALFADERRGGAAFRKDPS